MASAQPIGPRSRLAAGSPAARRVPAAAREQICKSCIVRMAKDPNAWCLEQANTGVRCVACAKSSHQCPPQPDTPEMKKASDELFIACARYDKNKPAAGVAAGRAARAGAKEERASSSPNKGIAGLFTDNRVQRATQAASEERNVLLDRIANSLESIAGDLNTWLASNDSAME
ncbi:hypothetical protein F5X96DRAFT_665679 [Biscogniauxia mediterranea]|nr:hypothetical protein F5X96DRAFT_665679 [Biscogniauxia mediterranea]